MDRKKRVETRPDPVLRRTKDGGVRRPGGRAPYGKGNGETARGIPCPLAGCSASGRTTGGPSSRRVEPAALAARRPGIHNRKARPVRGQKEKFPVGEGCAFYARKHFTRGYIRHLMVSKEIVGLYLASIHNLHFLLDTMRQIRQSIFDGTFETLKAERLLKLKVTSEK